MAERFDSDVRFQKPFIELTDRVLETGEVPLEHTDWDYLPTLRCNMGCKHCRQAVVREDHEWTEIADEMTMDQIRAAWDPIDVEGRIVKINGGEPFVKKEMWEILEYFKERGAYNVIATNSAVFRNPANTERLRELGLVEITTSFDGIGENHDIVRGRPGLFDTMTEFASNMARDHKVLLECCIQGDNVQDLPEMLRLKETLGIYKIRFQLPVFTTAEETAEASRVMGEQIEYEAQTMPSPTYDFSFETMMEGHRKMVQTGIEFDMHPKFFDLNPEAAYERRSRGEFGLLCTYMFRSKVDPNGDVRFCPYIVKSFGNLQNERLEDIWNNDEFRSFRQRVAQNNLLPSCENCPHTRIYGKK